MGREPDGQWQLPGGNIRDTLNNVREHTIIHNLATYHLPIPHFYILPWSAVVYLEQLDIPLHSIFSSR